jgi:hypothetical protein
MLLKKKKNNMEIYGCPLSGVIRLGVVNPTRLGISFLIKLPNMFCIYIKFFTEVGIL